MSKQDRARQWVNGYAVIGAGVAVATFLPGSTSIALISMEAHMCYEIGKIYKGDSFTLKQAIATAGVVGLASVVGKIAALEALNLVPFAGTVSKAAIAGTIIKGLGEAIISYYQEQELMLSPASVISETKAPSKTITLVGATGAGKSSTANALLGYNAFKAGAEHGTTTATAEKDYIRGYRLRDTPGLMDDADFYDGVWTAVQDSELVIYTTIGQLYRPELETVKRIRDNQSKWDYESNTSDCRQLALYVNMQDVKEYAMDSATRAREVAAIREQVSLWIPHENVVFGASSPIVKGISQPARIEALQNLIFTHINTH